MKKSNKFILLFVILFMVTIPTFSLNAKAKNNTYSISESNEAPSKYKKLKTYNQKTKHYYIFKDIFEKCEINKGGKVVIKKGTYTISNPICVPSNVTVILEDGVIIKKGTSTGTTLTASKSIFQFVRPSKLKTKKYGKSYNGEQNISFIGQGNVTIDLNYFERGLAFVMGHNKNIKVTGITFKNLNGGHFIEMDACENVLVKDCTFETAKKWTVGTKEAINIDTPDEITRGFNNIWSSHDKTPNKDVRITECTFRDLESCIGTHSASKKQSKSGLYDLNQWHSNIQIDNCVFDNISRTAIRVYSWKDSRIIQNKFTNENSDGQTLEVWSVDNFTFKNNILNNIGSIGYANTVSHYTKENDKIVKIPNQPYEPDYSYYTEKNIEDFYWNQAINMDEATLVISKGVTTPFPKTRTTIKGKDMLGLEPGIN